MGRNRRQNTLAGAAATLLLLGAGSRPLGAQDGDAVLAAVRDEIRSLTAGQRARLSGTLRSLAEGPVLRRTLAQRAPLAAAGTSALTRLTGGKVSDPSLDVAYSDLTGFTQNDTSTAWCGPTVVVAYRDTRSLVASPTSPLIGLSRSTDRGLTFEELALGLDVLAGALQATGPPAVACAGAEDVFVAVPLLDTIGAQTALVVRSSTDAGATWLGVGVISLRTTQHILDRPALIVDPRNPQILYASYTDVDSSGAVCGAGVLRTGIEIARSTDGGASWTTALPVTGPAASCSPESSYGSQLAVDGFGRVTVAWLRSGAVGAEIDIATSPEGGLAFGPAAKVAAISGVGDGVTLQGNIHIDTLPSLAIDRSGGSRNGTLYVAWNDGDTLGGVDLLGYAFSNVLISRSTDAGLSWSAATRVNNTIEPLAAPPGVAGRGTDQFMPALAVDRSGAIGVCFYDRRRDTRNFLIDRECARSVDGGTHWTNLRKSAKSFSSATGQDVLLAPDDMGDRDGLASDFLQLSSGFRGAYGDNALGNADVRSISF
jgi:hypothetical protein